LSWVLGHASDENDGAVEFSSCKASLDEKLFQTTWKNIRFYKAELNHDDGRLNGDGDPESQKPVRGFKCQF
jgi:hypothetical protein